MKILAYTLFIIALIACSSTSNVKNEEQSPPSQSISASSTISLRHVWSTDTVLTTAESAIYNKEQNAIYVSNIDGEPWSNDGKGFISKLDPSGNIEELNWVTGLNAPKGMGIVGNSLFVTDNDALVEIDIRTGQIKNRMVCKEDDPKLNDITVGKDGSVYVSASEINKVYVLQNGVLEVFAEEDYKRPNGLLAEENRLLVLSFNAGSLSQIDYLSKKLTRLADGIGKADGIIKLPGNQGFITSSWSGQIYHVSTDYTVTKLLDTEADSIGAADIEYIEDQRLLLVPTFYDNRLMAYSVVN